MNKIIARDAVEIRNEIHKTEAAFDEALLQSARLMQRVIRTRQNPGLPKNAGQEALIHLARAQRQVLDGTSDMFRVHDELSRFAREFNDKDSGEDTVVPTPTGYSRAAKAVHSE